MEQILKLYRPVYHGMEFRYQASNAKGSFSDFVLQEVMAGIATKPASDFEQTDKVLFKKLSKNEQIASEMMTSVKDADLLDVVVETDYDFVGKGTNVNANLVKRLIDYDERYLSTSQDASVFMSGWTKLKQLVGFKQKAVLVDIPEFLSSEKDKAVSIFEMKGCLRVVMMLFIGITFLPSVQSMPLMSSHDLDYIFNEFLALMAVFGGIFLFAPSYLRRKYAPVLKFIYLGGIVILLINQLGLLSKHQLTLLNYDYSSFSKFLIVVLLLFAFIGLGIGLVSNDYTIILGHEVLDLQQERIIKEVTPNVVLYRQGDVIASVTELHLTNLDLYQNFERTSF